MKRYSALLRDTWWMWAILLLFGIVMGFFSWVFFIAIPICLFSFIYFGLMRYDSDGNLSGDGRDS